MASIEYTGPKIAPVRRVPNVTVFFRRHHRLLSFIGGIIVFFTFVIKEQLGESWRRTVEAVEMAQYMYAIRLDTSHGRFRLDEIDPAMVRRPTIAKEKLVPLDEGERLRETTADLEMGNSDMRSRLSTLEILVDKLPDRMDGKTEFQKLRKDEDAWYNGTLMSRMVMERLYPLHSASTPEQLRQRNSLLEMREQQMQTMGAEGARLSSRVFGLEQEITREAKEIKETDERRSHMAGVISAMLYVIGWALGLAGRMVGPNTEDEEFVEGA